MSDKKGILKLGYSDDGSHRPYAQLKRTDTHAQLLILYWNNIIRKGRSDLQYFYGVVPEAVKQLQIKQVMVQNCH